MKKAMALLLACSMVLAFAACSKKQYTEQEVTAVVDVTDENGKTVTIENGKFTMPACDVTISCQWESTASQPTGGGITGFVIDGIPGTIDASGNIVVTMPYKTDVTALRPVITGVNIAEMTPASSEAVDFTKPVIYTVTLTDGTRIPVAPRRQSEFHQYWFDYLKRR